MTGKMWVDVPSGYMYGFPKVWDPSTDEDLSAWIYSNGYPIGEELHYVRTWPVGDV